MGFGEFRRFCCRSLENLASFVVNLLALEMLMNMCEIYEELVFALDRALDVDVVDAASDCGDVVLGFVLP